MQEVGTPVSLHRADNNLLTFDVLYQIVAKLKLPIIVKITKVENKDDELRHNILGDVIVMAAVKCHEGHENCYQTAAKLMSDEIEEEAACIIPFS